MYFVKLDEKKNPSVVWYKEIKTWTRMLQETQEYIIISVNYWWLYRAALTGLRVFLKNFGLFCSAPQTFCEHGVPQKGFSDVCTFCFRWHTTNVKFLHSVIFYETFETLLDCVLHSWKYIKILWKKRAPLDVRTRWRINVNFFLSHSAPNLETAT